MFALKGDAYKISCYFIASVIRNHDDKLDIFSFGSSLLLNQKSPLQKCYLKDVAGQTLLLTESLSTVGHCLYSTAVQSCFNPDRRPLVQVDVR